MKKAFLLLCTLCLLYTSVWEGSPFCQQPGCGVQAVGVQHGTARKTGQKLLHKGLCLDVYKRQGLFCSPWPEQALRANIHCQISLALNRIYTEWSVSYTHLDVYKRQVWCRAYPRTIAAKCLRFQGKETFAGGGQCLEP